jgi:hypothetical protein
MKNSRQALAALIVAAMFCVPAQASWFSDLTGVNIDPWHGQFQIGIPQPGRAIQQLPDQIRQLPQTIANLFNPGGLALAAAVRQAEGQAEIGAQPIPPSVYQQLLPFFTPDFLQSVHYNTFDRARITLDTAVLMLNNDIVAITLNDVVVFRNENDAQNVITWAHELTHVQQYRYMGIDTFANTYSTNAWILENQAIDQQSRVAQAIWGNQPTQQFAYFNVNGHYLYGDAAYNLYPADPSTGQLLGPANGHIFFQNGQYWAVDSLGVTWLAIRVR